MKTKKPKSTIKLTRLMARVNSEELQVIHKKAFVYAGGNMSLFLRMAALAFDGKKSK